MSTELTLLQLNDLHGYLEPHPELIFTARGPTFPRLGGLARIKTLFEQVRSERPGVVIALDNGDTFHGTHAAVSTKGEALVPAVNELGITAMTAHWEFAWGPEHAQHLAQQLKHPLLAANCYSEADGTRPFPGTITVQVGGMSVGIIGIAATIIDKVMPAHVSAGVRRTDGMERVRATTVRLRSDGAQLIVVLSLLGFPQDVQLVREPADFDVSLSAHPHNRLERSALVGKTLILQSGCHGSFIRRL